MEPSTSSSRTSAYKPALAICAAFGGAWVFVLVTLGAFTTSINAGMVFQDWPLSNGSLNPTGWLSNLDMFAEHSHRLSAGLMSLIAIGLAFWVWLTEKRAWLRTLAWGALALVIVQAVVGGLRVLLDPIEVPTIDTNAGELLAMLHACLAQLFVCAILAIAFGCSRSWIERPVPVSQGVRRLGVVCLILLFIQLAIAAVMRHSFAGMAIPTFPLSDVAGDLLPQVWGFKVGIAFAHRAMAAVLAVALVWFAIRIWRDRGAPLGMRTGASVLVALLALQITLGAFIIRTYRDPFVTTAHVLVGALTLATAFCLTWVAHRDPVEAGALR